MRKYFFVFIIPLILLFQGCNESKVKKLNKNFLNTKLGTIKNQKLIQYIPTKKKTIIVKAKKIIKPKKVNISIQKKKQRFKDILAPIVIEVYTILNAQYNDVKKDIENDSNHKFIEKLKVKYKAKTNQELLYALKPHPISIVMAQAAIESAWLTSRFTIEANNIFGVWSFNNKEPRIEASATRGTKKIYLKKYKNYKAAIFDYYKSIGRSWAYPIFRKQRTLTNDPYILVDYLESYSEKKKIYTNTLKKMIKSNKFYEYDIKR